MKLTIPELSLVLLIGPSSSGKSTFARKHFKPTEILSSDFCRALVSDNENNQAATRDAFDVLHFIAAKRLAARKLTVIDATSVLVESRKPLLALAYKYHVIPVAIVFNLPKELCQERARQRTDRNLDLDVIHRHYEHLQHSLPELRKEGFQHIFTFSTLEEVNAAVVERQPLKSNRRYEHGPFDIIGDVHGCFDELIKLLETLGYEIATRSDLSNSYVVRHPQKRKIIFLGDLVDRGPNIPGVLCLVMSMVESDAALCVPGNHDMKLLRKLSGKNVRITHGLAASLEQLEQGPPEFKEQVMTFLDSLVSHYVLDSGKLVVAHAGMKKGLQGRCSDKVHSFALYGETTGEVDEFGLPVRLNWAAEYRGRAMVVYGHTPVLEAKWLNRTINIDTGCVFGGKLTALRYPEKELVSVPAARVYYQSPKPL